MAWKEKLDVVKKRYNFDFVLKTEQEEIITNVLQRKDVFGQLPTGFGKSLIYTLIPLLLDEMCKTINTALVISPLKALMQDQVQHLQSHKINAVSITEEVSPEDLRSENFQIIFASPEAVNQPRWRRTIKALQKNICVLVFDEAHCISQWGLDFRPDYRSVATIQSFLSAVPTLVLTATSTADIQKDIYEVLGMTQENTVVTATLPNRPNIYLEMVQCKDKFMEVLDWLPLEINQDITKIKKTILYVRSITVCHQIFSWLLESMGENIFSGEPHPDNRVMDMFHANTDKESKERILGNFANPKGKIKLLISTVAFGMGVNIPDVDLIIHWGLPSSCLSYWQEVGRCARDGRPGYAVCYAFKRSITKCTDEDFKKLAQTCSDEDASCLRFAILKKFLLTGISVLCLSELKIKDKDGHHDDCKDTCLCLKCKCCCICNRSCQCNNKSINMLQDFRSKK